MYVKNSCITCFNNLYYIYIHIYGLLYSTWTDIIHFAVPQNKTNI